MINEGQAKLLKERRLRYGKMKDVAYFTQTAEEIAKSLPGYGSMTLVERESLHMILQKIGRAVSGDPHYDDNPKDIIGYAQRWLEDIEENNVPTITDRVKK